MQVRSLRSLEELRAAIVLSQRTFGLPDRHRGGFFDSYASRFAQQSDVMVIAEGKMVGTVLGSIQGDHLFLFEARNVESTHQWHENMVTWTFLGIKGG